MDKIKMSILIEAIELYRRYAPPCKSFGGCSEALQIGVERFGLIHGLAYLAGYVAEADSISIKEAARRIPRALVIGTIRTIQGMAADRINPLAATTDEEGVTEPELRERGYEKQHTESAEWCPLIPGGPYSGYSWQPPENGE